MEVKVKIKKNEGITLLVLVVTIIVILILSTITINMLTGENGIIKNTGKAKEAIEIANEKEIVQRATVNAIGKNKYGDLKQDELEKQLNEEQEGKTEVTDVGDEFEILFKESNRYYTVDKDGNIKEEQIATKIENAGDITKNNQYDGSEERPYQISCIEDLVAWSNMAQGSGVIYQNGKIENVSRVTTFSGKYIELTRDLNFKSNYSYGDSTRTDFGDLNTDGTIETIKEELTKTDEGCIGFSPIGTGNKNSYFNGNNNTIKNIYIHRQNGNSALFFYAGDIKNLNLTGTVITDTWEAGGIACNANNIENCINYANITGYNYVAGICSTSGNYIKNCVNYGDITITGAVYVGGGAGGISNAVKELTNCINYGSITGKSDSVGGITGMAEIGGGKTINFCKNYGKITVENSTWKGCGGLAASSAGNLKIMNSVNYGDINGIHCGGVIGSARRHKLEFKS